MTEQPKVLISDEQSLVPNTKNSLGAAIVAASLASTFAKPQRIFTSNPLFVRLYKERHYPSPEERQRNLDAQQEAIAKAKAKRERKSQAKKKAGYTEAFEAQKKGIENRVNNEILKILSPS